METCTRAAPECESAPESARDAARVEPPVYAKPFRTRNTLESCANAPSAS
jgi:hypothetical protein